ncbi:MAG TPA: hypothetical protein VJR29_13680 [bacterium]|nr:hypothetical protein [bacterium]
MLPSWDSIAAIFTLLGVGTVIGAWGKSKFERKREVLKQQQDFKFTRYKCLINLMHAALDFEKHKQALHDHGRRNFQTLKDLMDELESEYINMLLFADKRTQELVFSFIQTPSSDLLKKTALAMRKDLWSS